MRRSRPHWIRKLREVSSPQGADSVGFGLPATLPPMRIFAASTLAFGSLFLGGCFEDPPSTLTGTTEGTSAGTSEGTSEGTSAGTSSGTSDGSSSAAPETTGEDAEPISLFDLACGASNQWYAQPDVNGDVEVLLACGIEGMDGAKVEPHEEIVLSDDQSHSNVIAVAPPRLAQGGVVGDFLQVDLSGFQTPVLRVGLACGEGTDDCLVDISIVTFDPARPELDLGPADGRTVNGTSGLSLLELDLQTEGLEDVDTIVVIVFVSGGPGAVLREDDVGYLVDMRIEEK